jgi:hypothetical protein
MSEDKPSSAKETSASNNSIKEPEGPRVSARLGTRHETENTKRDDGQKRDADHDTP